MLVNEGNVLHRAMGTYGAALVLMASRHRRVQPQSDTPNCVAL